MKKVIYTLNIGGNYAPEITKLTYPYMKMYADKIGADFKIIDERKFPDYPLWYEKVQIFELGQDNDWNIYIDADCLINPLMFDLTEIIPHDTVSTFGAEPADTYFKLDNYFLRDRRNIKPGSFFVVAPSSCLDIWEPIDDLSPKEILDRITPTKLMDSIGYSADFCIDDYVISRNIAKYGLKYKAFRELFSFTGSQIHDFIYHDYGLPKSEKIIQIKQTLKNWNY